MGLTIDSLLRSGRIFSRMAPCNELPIYKVSYQKILPLFALKFQGRFVFGKRLTFHHYSVICIYLRINLPCIPTSKKGRVIQIDLRKKYIPAKTLGKALEKEKNKNYTLKTISGVNHLFQTCKSGSPFEYEQLPEIKAPDVLDLIVEWIDGWR